MPFDICLLVKSRETEIFLKPKQKRKKEKLC